MPSLYANLLDPKAKTATISGAPVKYEFKKQDEPPAEEKKPDAALRFQPVKRPGVQQKPKARPSAANLPSTKSKEDGPDDRIPPPDVSKNATTIEQWTTADDDYDDDPYAAEYNRRMEEARRAQRAGKKKKKKGRTEHYVDWDRVYDPERPTRLEEYHGSEEQVQAVHEWKMRLHAHQMRRRPRESSSPRSDDESRGPQRAYAPPSQYSFAPPSFADDHVMSTSKDHSQQADTTPAPASIDRPSISGQDAYLRRTQMSDAGPQSLDSRPDQPPPPPPPPPPPETMLLPTVAAAPGTLASVSDKSALKAPSASAIISAAPVRYSRPDTTDPDRSSAGPDQDAVTDTPYQDEEVADDQPRSSRPGQRGFAKRLLEKYGWTEGQGLGASNDGIVSILSHQKAKRKKRADAEGGGWIGPAGGVARIVGGKRRKVDDDDAAADDGGGDAAAAAGERKEQKWSIVAVFGGMLVGVDVQAEMREGSLMQNIGDAMGKFGIVERLFIESNDQGGTTAAQAADADAAETGPRVFVKFTSALSAYRAIQASDGQDFLGNGCTVHSAFFDADKFDAGVYR